MNRSLTFLQEGSTDPEILQEESADSLEFFREFKKYDFIECPRLGKQFRYFIAPIEDIFERSVHGFGSFARRVRRFARVF